MQQMYATAINKKKEAINVKHRKNAYGEYFWENRKELIIS